MPSDKESINKTYDEIFDEGYKSCASAMLALFGNNPVDDANIALMLMAKYAKELNSLRLLHKLGCTGVDWRAIKDKRGTELAKMEETDRLKVIAEEACVRGGARCLTHFGIYSRLRE